MLGPGPPPAGLSSVAQEVTPAFQPARRPVSPRPVLRGPLRSRPAGSPGDVPASCPPGPPRSRPAGSPGGVPASCPPGPPRSRPFRLQSHPSALVRTRILRRILTMRQQKFWSNYGKCRRFCHFGRRAGWARVTGDGSSGLWATGSCRTAVSPALPLTEGSLRLGTGGSGPCGEGQEGPGRLELLPGPTGPLFLRHLCPLHGGKGSASTQGLFCLAGESHRWTPTRRALAPSSGKGEVGERTSASHAFRPCVSCDGAASGDGHRPAGPACGRRVLDLRMS